jgi:hypothetical protein
MNSMSDANGGAQSVVEDVLSAIRNYEFRAGRPISVEAEVAFGGTSTEAVERALAALSTWGLVAYDRKAKSWVVRAPTRRAVQGAIQRLGELLLITLVSAENAPIDRKRIRLTLDDDARPNDPFRSMDRCLTALAESTAAADRLMDAKRDLALLALIVPPEEPYEVARVVSAFRVALDDANVASRRRAVKTIVARMRAVFGLLWSSQGAA